jgi:hypothetical protein
MDRAEFSCTSKVALFLRHATPRDGEEREEGHGHRSGRRDASCFGGILATAGGGGGAGRRARSIGDGAGATMAGDAGGISAAAAPLASMEVGLGIE